MTDSYKVSHYRQYPPKTERVYSYLESRGGRFNKTVFFGPQYLLKKYLVGEVVTTEKIDEAEEVWNLHMGGEHFNRSGWEYIRDNCGGRLPIEINAVPEGTVVPTNNVLMTVENTDPNCYWLTNYLETLLVQCWYPITVATQSWYIKRNILNYLDTTGSPETIGFKLHDFGFRGVSSVETAGIGAAAHLVNFMGTDTFAGVMLARKYYGADMPGFSIPASEHSTITSWGKPNEVDAMRNMLEQYPTGLVACVSDSFDIYHACRELWGNQLRNKVLERDGTLVIRPDSGDPTTVILEVIKILGERFGYTKNDKDYKVLDPHVRIIQGDGVNYDTISSILWNLMHNGWSADNIAFGSGGALLQKMDRDTQKFAFKCSSIRVDDEWFDVYKDPVTDSGKQSKRGQLGLYRWNDNYYTDEKGLPGDLLRPIFCNGELLQDDSFDEIRKRSEEV